MLGARLVPFVFVARGLDPTPVRGVVATLTSQWAEFPTLKYGKNLRNLSISLEV